MASDRMRLFVAVDVPDDIRAEVAAACAPLRAAAGDARWVAPQRWHLTLAFLGGRDHDDLAGIGRALGAAAAATTVFDLALDGSAGTFRREVLWAGLRSSPALSQLAERVRAGLAAESIPSDDKPFRAHLTLARSRRSSRLPAGLEQRYAGPVRSWTVQAIRLVRSQPGRGGSRYSTVSQWSLSADT